MKWDGLVKIPPKKLFSTWVKSDNGFGLFKILAVGFVLPHVSCSLQPEGVVIRL